MKISRSKTEYMCVNERDGDGRVSMENIEIKKVQEFKYLGQQWIEMETFTRKLARDCSQIKGKVYRTCVRPAIMYGLETIPLTIAAESKMEVAEMRMLRFSLGLTRLNRVPN
ncbi:uncharacterized protein LOC134774776 [Penaeus indicus]|uniref:uncharacterized protein LOC134774776 n=1 Tax=Penaeus indicus TaxID=29960 RepID=UPI00300C64C7